MNAVNIAHTATTVCGSISNSFFGAARGGETPILIIPEISIMNLTWVPFLFEQAKCMFIRKAYSKLLNGKRTVLRVICFFAIGSL